ncbi:MAG: division/cell wall cluster transcriptional repressor MraZ [Planctomycetaceae bacterium]
MDTSDGLLLGEFIRRLDERYRLAIPAELSDRLMAGGDRCLLAKERAGCLSLWQATEWEPRIQSHVSVLRTKLEAGVFARRVGDVQDLGRLLSTRHREVTLAVRGRLVVPESFREFLGVEPGGEVVVVGAAICVEIWDPAAWRQFIAAEMPEFRRRLDELTA